MSLLKVTEKHKIGELGLPVSPALLERILTNHFGYSIDPEGLKEYPDLINLRSVYVPKKKKLLLNHNLTDIQKAFQYSKELAFNCLGLKDRANTSSLLRVNSFDQVLNHFKASYFATAILLPRDIFLEDLRKFFNNSTWDGEAFIGLMRKYNASPEMLFQRLTNLIPRFFGLQKLFFLRFVHQPRTDRFVLDKELHLEGKHHPHSNGLSEHYCRRWLGLTLLKDLYTMQQTGKYVGTIVGAQRSRYFGTEDEYLCFTLARPASPTPDQNVSVTIGLLVNDELKEKVKFFEDVSIAVREVNRTCERCAIEDCKDRASEATFIKRKEARRRLQDSLKEVLDS